MHRSQTICFQFYVILHLLHLQHLSRLIRHDSHKSNSFFLGALLLGGACSWAAIVACNRSASSCRSCACFAIARRPSVLPPAPS
eukprot:m.244329 g.244329  ORF g.244329 m.244329 type:complete len:84 (-) comp17465_c0_seq12:3239-3490(-)